MRQFFRYSSYRLRISMFMVLFAVIPFSLFSFFYLKSEKQKWEAAALSNYSQMLAAGSENLNRGIQEMELNLLYVSNISTIRTAISHINSMNLVEGLDHVNVLRETASSITADNKHLVVRWYPYLSSRNYVNNPG